MSKVLDDDFMKDPSVNVTLEPAEPPDRYNMVYLVHVLLGVGLMMPWNSWITPFDFWASQFNVPGVFDFPFVFFLSIVFNYATVIFLLLSVWLSRIIPAKVRVVIVFAPQLFIMAFVPFLEDLVTERYARIGVLYGLVFASGACTAIGFGVVMGMAAQFPFQYTVAVMMGQGVGGVVVGAIRIITKVALGDDIHTSTLIYFMLAAASMALCLVGYFLMQLLPFSKYHLQKASRTQIVETVSSALLDDVSDDEAVSSAAPTVSTKVVLRKVWKHMLAVFMVFFVTLAIFPGFTGLIPTSNHECSWVNAGWFGIIMIALFQFFDWVGRSLPRFIIIIKDKILIIPVVLRLVFVLLFAFCVHPRYFPSDWAAYAIMVLFALTNGYMGTLAMSYGVQGVDDHEKDLAGNLLSLALNSGIFCAVHISILLLYLFAPCSMPSFWVPESAVCNITVSCFNASSTAEMFF